jgi:hypothetical protein
MGDFTIIQMTDPFECLKNFTEITCIKDQWLDVGYSREFPLPDHQGGFECITSVSAGDFDGSLTLDLNWMDPDGVILAKDSCTFEAEKGIRKEWDSLAIRWNRHYGGAINGIQMTMTRHPLQEITGSKRARNRRVFTGIPVKASMLQVQVKDVRIQSGRLRVDRMEMRTY